MASMSSSSGVAPTQVSSLPLPPLQYVNLYTDDNIRRNRAPLPPPPIEGGYSMFGATCTAGADDPIVRPLEVQGFRRLYPANYDPKKELKKLNFSILANFMDLLDILINAPDSPKRKEKLEDISVLFIHLHHLINEFRPHQARETLRVMMDVQRQERLDVVSRFQKHMDRIKEILRATTRILTTDADVELEGTASERGTSSLSLLSQLRGMTEGLITENGGLDMEDTSPGDSSMMCTQEDRMMTEYVDSLAL
ncbi:unnamed protein product [Cyprideis torosa]|uniref:Mediator of RNA polymerase II transcription subunit 7 n=1 Tax=Cyprideis torosa TaxID=163714 RepID=A0A7R8ZKZ7_9CRUS|nr:unnamed protein product [Cyprideis torosa]CAG0881303.1 unnamed protein product [Cyprideis torosa]